MAYSIFDLIGNLGVFLIIISYLLLQLDRLTNDNIIYSLMNLFGASFVIISLIESFNMSAFIIEIFWVGISMVGVIKTINKRKLIK